MKSLTLSPMLAMLGLGGGEIILILASLLFVLLAIGSLVVLGLWFARRNPSPTSPPPAPPNPPTRRFCHQCGNEMAAGAPQGLCPSCLMKVALGSEGGNPAGAGERKPAPPPAEIAAHFPQLEILELLGQGGMGMVYKARQRQLDRLVALKILPSDSGRDPAFAERFSREARALARLNHPNIVSVYDFGQTDGLYYFMMEFVDGVNLRQMERTRQLTPKEALTIVPRICDALQYAHDEGIVHRDIKPENILIDKKGRVKIADFGLAKLLGQAAQDFRLTDVGRIMGTPHYMAPEQVEHPLDVDHRADIYSLGVVFYEMLTGELPLGKFASPSQKVQVDVRLDEVVLKSLEKEPARRYQQVSEVKTCVETITGGPPSVSPPPPPKPREDRFWKRFAVVIASCVAALILVPIAAIVLAMALPAFVKSRDRARHERVVAAANAGAASNLTFGPVIEQTLPLNALGYSPCLDPESSEAVMLPSALTAQDWSAITLPFGFVIIAPTNNAPAKLAATGIAIAPMLDAPEAWMRLPAKLPTIDAEATPDQTVTVTAAGKRPPHTFVFKTLRGTSGLLQITGFTDRPSGVAVRYKLVQTGSPTNSVLAAAASWSPSATPGEKPDPERIRQEAKDLMERGRYEEALQRQIWYHNHALDYNAGLSGVRLSFALSDWIELGRRYPAAKQALIEIRDAKTREFSKGRGFSALFQEVASINEYLQAEDATVTLFKTIQQQDAALAYQSFFFVENLLVARGEYELCLKSIGDPQTRFDVFQRGWQRQKQIQRNLPTRTLPQPPRASPLPDMAQLADTNFIKQVRSLVEILVGGGRMAEAQSIRDQAVAIMDDPRLQSAVSDAEKRVAANVPLKR